MNVFAQPFAIMGIVNVTPDSFYDGGRFASAEKAVEHGLRLVEEGASILDIGGASSRPGAQTVSHEEETRRILPVIAGCAKKTSVPISVDTTRSFVARAAAAEGATWINDISAGRADAGMKQFIAESGCTVVLMHSRGTPQTMQQCTGYGDVVNEVKNELIASATAFCEAGVPKRKIVIDPGIGFAKTAEQNVALLHGCGAFVATGFPVLVGPPGNRLSAILPDGRPKTALPGPSAASRRHFYAASGCFGSTTWPRPLTFSRYCAPSNVTQRTAPREPVTKKKQPP
jgi:dihydropteroate synthase